MYQTFNGRIDEDKGIGYFTFTGTNGNSVANYVLCSTDLTYLVISDPVITFPGECRVKMLVANRCNGH